LLAFLVILSLAYPLRRLTSAGPAAPAAAKPLPVAGMQEIGLQLTFTTPPKSLKILHLGQEVWNDASPKPELERKLQLAYPKEGVDLRIQAEYREAAPLAAVRVRLTDPQGVVHEKTLWGPGSIDEVLTFP
jgi:hypothetical protein